MAATSDPQMRALAVVLCCGSMVSAVPCCQKDRTDVG